MLGALLAVSTAVGLYRRDKSATVALIEPGMTRTEVERLLGGPPGDYRSSATVDDITYDGVTLEPRAEFHVYEWLTDKGVVAVAFGKEGTVVDKRLLKPWTLSHEILSLLRLKPENGLSWRARGRCRGW